MSSFSNAAGRIQEAAARLKAEAEAAKAQAEAAAKKLQKKAEDQDTGTGPVGEGDYVVGAGECISSIAKDKGYYWKTLWDANPALASVRKDPNVLLTGDKLTLPPKKPKLEYGATETRHRFVRKGEPASLKLRLLVGGEPQSGMSFKIVFDGKTEMAGMTDADGSLEVPMPGNTKSAILSLQAPDGEVTYEFALGNTDPVTELTGIQHRLANLGFRPGTAAEQLTDATRQAIRKFQSGAGLPVTGIPDSATIGKLMADHGS